MSCNALTTTRMDAQLQSPFFSLALEVREAIYSYLLPDAIHVFMQEGKVTTSACVMPEQTWELDGSERRTAQDSLEDFRWIEERQISGALPKDHTWARRVRSKWGPHWRCEEVAQGIEIEPCYQAEPDLDCKIARYKTARTMHQACKRTHMEFSEMVNRSVVFNAMDLEVLQLLARGGPNANFLAAHHDFSCAVRSSMRHLSITFLPRIDFFTDIQCDNWKATPSDPTVPDLSMEAIDAPGSGISEHTKRWFHLWHDLGRQLKQIESLQLWLDHDSFWPWTIVSERVILLPFLTSMSPSHFSRLQDVLIKLPLLHPRWEKEPVHFTPDNPEPPPGFTIIRRLRQRYRCEEWDEGDIRVNYRADFPEMLGYEDLSFEGIQKFERKLYRDAETPP